jgi:hypothetical protein
MSFTGDVSEGVTLADCRLPMADWEAHCGVRRCAADKSAR